MVDNFGSGTFLPLTVLFVVRSVGLSLGVAGALVTLGTLAGLVAPAAVGRASHRFSPRAVVVVSMLIQAAGMACYLLADDEVVTVVAAALVAAGTQTFYSALFALISNVTGTGSKDHAFAAVDMARAAAFGSGTLLAALLLSVASTTALQVAVAIDAGSFVIAAGLLVMLVHPDAVTHPRTQHDRHEARGRVGRDRPFLILIATVALLALVTDFFLLGLPAYALAVLHTAGWVPGVCVAMLTVATSTLSGLVLRRLGGTPRTTALAIGAACYLLWCLLGATADFLPASWAAPWLLAATVALIAGSLTAGTRANAIAEATAPQQFRDRYLATFQYAFTVAGLIAPLLVSLFAVTTWLPWVVVACAALLAASALPWLARTLPAHAVRAPTLLAAA